MALPVTGLLPPFIRRAVTNGDLYGRVSWRYRATVLGAVLAAYGIASATRQLPKALDVVMATAGVVVTVRELRELRRQARTTVFVERANERFDDLAAADPSAVQLDSGSGSGFFYPVESDLLRTRDVRAEVAAEDFRIHPSLKEWSLAFLTQQKGATFFNGDVVGLAAFAVAADLGQDEVVLRRCGYFDFIATNILARHDVEDGQGKVLEGRRLFVNRFDRLRPFDGSRLANVIGISTLAFSDDGKLLLVQQTKRNVGSPGLRAPSGSGALEKRDLREDADTPDVLADVICRGVARELSEECHLDPSEIEATHLVGFGRWLTRGAMPEFAAVSFVRGDGDAIAARAVRRSEREYVQGVRAVRLRPRAQWSPQDPLSPLPQDERDKVSFPLVLALTALVRACGDPDWQPASELVRRLDS